MVLNNYPCFYLLVSCILGLMGWRCRYFIQHDGDMGYFISVDSMAHTWVDARYGIGTHFGERLSQIR